MYLQPTQESVLSTIQRLPDEGGFVMLNLFRLRDEPDYSKFPDLEPDTPMGSRELFHRYIAEMDPFLDRYGIKRIFLADGAGMLIGPADERWDVVQMVRYPSKHAFIALSSDPEVDAHVPLREMAVDDSRIMPMFEQDLDSVHA